MYCDVFCQNKCTFIVFRGWMWKFVWMSFSFFTVRKRSLRRLYFYTWLLVILFTGGVSRPMPRGCLPGGCPGPSPGGVQVQRGVQEQARWGVQTHAGGGVQGQAQGGVHPACTEAGPPPTADGYCCGQYASYWNVFLFIHFSWSQFNL